MTLQPAVRVLVVDDHRSYAEAVNLALGRFEGIEAVGCASSVDEGMRAVDDDRADVVIMDWQLPDIDGVEGIRRIKVSRPQTVVILVSGHASPDLERIASFAGAAAVLPKESSMADIVDIVRRCANGEVLTPNSAESPESAESFVSLSPREAEVLWLLAKGRGTPMIAEDLFLSVHTIRGYVKALSVKLGAHSRLELIAVARRRGLLPE